MLFGESLSGSTHILLKMYHLEYFSATFSNPHKVLKENKKHKYSNYEANVAEIFKTKIQRKK
jgi:hypothetical protein